MANNIYHVIGTRHYVNIAVIINVARITCFLIAGEMCKIAFLETLERIPKRWPTAGLQWQFYGNCVKYVWGHLVAVFV
ncbi:MAG: hypothetical protein ACI9O0_000897 [Paracoccaceae bacterium]|jgi:hypothetical protein